MLTSRCLPALLVLLPAAPLTAQDSKPSDKHLLRYSLQKGDIAHCKIVTKQDMEMNQGGQAMNQASEYSIYMTIEVTDASDSGAKIASTLTRIAMDMDNPMMPMTFDTDDEDSVPAMLDPVLDMIDQTTTSELDARGAQTNVVVPEAFSNPRTAGIGLDPQQMLAQFLVTFPEESVGVGDTWPASYERSMGQMGSMKVEIVNKLDSLEGSVVTISQDIQVEIESAMPIPMTTDVKSASGKVVVDLGKIIPREASTTMDLSMAMDHPQMKMEMSSTSVSTLEHTEAPAPKAEEKDDGDN